MENKEVLNNTENENSVKDNSEDKKENVETQVKPSDVIKNKEEKVFTQQEVDKIVQDRVARANGTTARVESELNNAVDKIESLNKELKEKEDQIVAQDTNLRKLERENIKLGVANKTGWAPEKIDALKWDTKEELEEAVNVLTEISNVSTSSFFNGKNYNQGSSSDAKDIAGLINDLL